jgi:glycosyltransferase involved in cell wall biosynthesis
LNILFVDQFSDPGGAQLCLQDLMPEIVRRGWAARLMVPGSGELVQWSRRAGIPTHALPLRPYSNGTKTALDCFRFSVDVPRSAATVCTVVKQEGVDLVYVNGPRVLPAALGLSCPVVFHAHSHVSVGYGRKIIEWTLRAARARVIAASAFVAENYCRVPGRQKVRVIYNGVRDLQGEARSLRRRPLRIGVIGRIAAEKGQLDFVRLAQRIAEDGGEAEFFIYGKRLFSDAAYEAQVRAIAGNALVTFCGWTDDVGAALRGLEILVVPSGPGEAATRVIMEAFSAGTPVVAYRSGGIPELVDHDRTGLLADSGDLESLARSIRSLMENPEQMERLAAAGRSEWQRRFRIENFQTDVCDLLERCARPAPDGALPMERLSSI